MPVACRCLGLVLLLSLLASGQAAAQPLADSVVVWRGYSRTGTTHVRIYPSPPEEETRVHTVVLRELAANEGPSTVADIRYLADLLGRQFGIDPAHAYWIVHWGAFSYNGAAPDADKELFLRVTFRRTQSGRLSSPYWRVVTRDDVRALTDRRWRNEGAE
jgi:hypothetical protein